MKKARIYNRVLNASEISALYNEVDLASGLVAHYPLATNSLDTSGNGYDGVDTNVTYSANRANFNSSRITYPLTLDWN